MAGYGVDPRKDPCQVCVNHRQQHAQRALVALILASRGARVAHLAHAHDVTTSHSSSAIAICSSCPPLPLPSPPHCFHRCLRHCQSEGARCHYRLPDPLHLLTFHFCFRRSRLPLSTTHNQAHNQEMLADARVSVRLGPHRSLSACRSAHSRSQRALATWFNKNRVLAFVLQ